MVSQVSNNVDLSPVGRVTLVQQLQNCMPLATGLSEWGCSGRVLAGRAVDVVCTLWQAGLRSGVAQGSCSLW